VKFSRSYWCLFRVSWQFPSNTATPRFVHLWDVGVARGTNKAQKVFTSDRSFPRGVVSLQSGESCRYHLAMKSNEQSYIFDRCTIERNLRHQTERKNGDSYKVQGTSFSLLQDYSIQSQRRRARLARVAVGKVK
jgi:hypothetical protein